MKKNIHPKYQICKVTCISCNTTFETRSTLENIRVDVCSNCHPFYTGKQKFIHVYGRAENFNKRHKLEQKK